MRQLLGFIFSLLVSFQILAEEAPDALVQRVTDEVIGTARKDPDIQNGNVDKAMALVDSKVMPHFNLHHLTALAVGKKYWGEASPEQQDRLAKEFSVILARTFANYLTIVRNEKFRYKAAEFGADTHQATVRTVVSEPGSETVYVDYSLEKLDSGWKAYDVVVAGIDLAVSYREQFAGALAAGGIEGLIQAVSQKNKSVLARAKDN